MYKPELSALPAEQRRHVLIALEALTDHESWARMREQHGLPFDEARLFGSMLLIDCCATPAGKCNTEQRLRARPFGTRTCRLTRWRAQARAHRRGAIFGASAPSA